MSRQITYGEFIDAIERDGLPKVTGTLFRAKPRGKEIDLNIPFPIYNRGKENSIGAACAVGQACINLGIEQPFAGVVTSAMSLNDNHSFSLKEIARRLRIRYKDRLHTQIFVKEFDYMPYVNKDVYKPQPVGEEVA